MNETSILILTIVGAILLVIIGLIIHFIPTIIAFKRHTSSRWVIFLVNLFFGWTLLVWIIALIWACEGSREEYF